MKKSIYLSAILCAVALLGGCKDDDTEVDFGLDCNAIENLPATGATERIKVSANGEWVAMTDAPWITISPANGRGTAACEIRVDSALTNELRTGVVRIQSQGDWEQREITVSQQGFDYMVNLEDKNQAKINIADFAVYGKRYFDVKLKTNVRFKVNAEGAGWLRYDVPNVSFDRGIRPREVIVRFNWDISSIPEERIANVTFEPVEEDIQLASADGITVVQKAAPKIEPDTRSGDSIALLGAARSLGTWSDWDSNVGPMDNWDNVTLWEEGDEGSEGKVGRVRRASFYMINTREPIPYEIQYLTAAEDLEIYGNTNSYQLSLNTGDAITKLTQLRRLTIGGYGLSELHEDFKNLKNLEYLNLSVNNFQNIPEIINPTALPKLRALVMNACQRNPVYDLSNTILTEFGGLHDMTPEDLGRLIKWDVANNRALDSIILSVNYIEMELPDFEDDPEVQKFTAEEIEKADTLPVALVGYPKVLLNTKQFSINLNRFTGAIPRWLKYHPALNFWSPMTLIFEQEGKNSKGESAGFSNMEPNMNYYYDFYEGFKTPDPGAEEEGEDSTITK